MIYLSDKMNALKNEIFRLVGKDPEQLDKVLAQFELVKLKRNQYLFMEGEVCRSVFFVQKGLLQVLITDKNGVEKTNDIILENNWFTDLESFQNKTNSLLSVKATKSTLVYQIHLDSFMDLMKNVPKFAEAYNAIIEAKYKELTNRINAFNGSKSHERIEWLHQYKPEFLMNVPDKLIASYLGISKETYCRQKQLVKNVAIYQ